MCITSVENHGDSELKATADVVTGPLRQRAAVIPAGPFCCSDWRARRSATPIVIWKARTGSSTRHVLTARCLTGHRRFSRLLQVERGVVRG